METMHAAGRRNLPPVPRPAADHAAASAPAGRRPDETPVERTLELVRRPAEDTPAEDTPAEDGSASERDAQPHADVEPDDGPNAASDAEADVEPDAESDAESDAQQDGASDEPDIETDRLGAADEPEYALDDDDPAQHFVSRLRSAASEFAAAAEAESAVVREAVPPARHRRSRCRVVLRYADGAEADLTFVGAVGRPGTPAWQDFHEQIQHWLGTGQQRQAAWLVEDTEAPDGVAVDVPAWLAAG
jgi:hypothetical protein